MTGVVKVKICGIKTRLALEWAIEAGADMVGLVFFAKSPRNLTLPEARALAAVARGRALIVALTVNATDDDVAAIVQEVKPDYLQLHGEEGVERLGELKARFGIDLIKAVKVGSAADISASRAFEAVASKVLFDARPEPSAAALPGGNGVSFDWRWFEGQPIRRDFMLSGGLTCDNVALAVAQSGAGFVDVSSGVEGAPGVKDAALIAKFIERAKNAPQS